MSYGRELHYESAIAPDITGNKGPLRFEEGIATDTDVPNEFGRGAYGDTAGDGRSRPFTCIKPPAETMRERAHVGSASWVEGQQELSEFVQGAYTDHPTFERVGGSEARLIRPNVARIG